MKTCSLQVLLSLKHFFTELKVRAVDDLAKRLLLSGNSVDAVAYELGYENASNFRRRFTKNSNLSSSDWLAREPLTQE